MALEQVKSMYQTLRNYFSMIENDFGHMDVFGPYPYESIFGGETCKFAYYMAAADGRLDERERLYINEITGYGESTQSMMKAIEQSGVVMSDERESFAQTPFKCLVIAQVADSVYKEAGQDSNILKLALTFFVLLGTDLMSVDGQILPSEQASLQAIVDTMQIVAQQTYDDQKQNSREDSADTPRDVASVVPEETSAEVSTQTHEETSADASAEAPTETVDTQTSEDNAPVSPMSVEEIVAELNGTEKSVDITSGLELSIGDNGASYIAFHLAPAMRALICPELTDKDVPVLLVGNTICVSYDNQIIKKHLLNGAFATRDIAREVVDSINHSVSPIAGTNTVKIEENGKLAEIINDMLNISTDSSFVSSLNDYLDNQNSHLRIVPSDTGEYTVSDQHHTNHSLEEVLWNLSFTI